MGLSKIIHSFIVVSLMTSFCSEAFSEELCVKCMNKELEGAPNVVAVNGLAKEVSLVVGKMEPAYSFGSYQNIYCTKYQQIELNSLNQMIRDLKETPYPVDEYFQKPGCEPQKVGNIKSPILHLTAEAPCSRTQFPEIIHKYYTVKRKEPDMWLRVVNSKNTSGETYLDYIESLRKQNEFSTEDSKECVKQLIKFACETGAVYSKFKMNCPTSTNGA